MLTHIHVRGIVLELARLFAAIIDHRARLAEKPATLERHFWQKSDREYHNSTGAKVERSHIRWQVGGSRARRAASATGSEHGQRLDCFKGRGGGCPSEATAVCTECRSLAAVLTLIVCACSMLEWSMQWKQTHHFQSLLAGKRSEISIKGEKNLEKQTGAGALVVDHRSCRCALSAA